MYSPPPLTKSGREGSGCTQARKYPASSCSLPGIPKDIFSSRTKGEKFTFHLAFYRLRRRRDRWREKGFFSFFNSFIGFPYTELH